MSKSTDAHRHERLSTAKLREEIATARVEPNGWLVTAINEVLEDVILLEAGWYILRQGSGDRKIFCINNSVIRGPGK